MPIASECLKTRAMSALVLCFCQLASALASAESAPDKIQQAINVVEALCLSGSEYALSADQQGNITVKSFAKDKSNSVTLNVRETRGAAAYQDDLRIIGDDKIRACTQQHIGRVLDAVLEQIPAQEVSQTKNNSIGTAKFLGYVPDYVSAHGFAEAGHTAYFRISVKEPANIRFGARKNVNTLRVTLLTASDNLLSRAFLSANKKSESVFLLPSDYFLALTPQISQEATAYELFVEGVAE